MPGIYVHLPFCPYICPYCDFAKWPHRRSAADRYLRALRAEIAHSSSTPAATIFLGGGTPNAYDAKTLTELLGELRARFPHPAGALHEVSVEVNPELVEEGDFDAYRSAGVTRISIGAQSFVPSEVNTLGRRHTAEQVRAVVRQARAAGMSSVSLDLIFGVPGQTIGSWRSSLEAAVSLGVDHVSTYGLTVEEGTPYFDWREREPGAFMDDTREAELYAAAIDTLESAGYDHYEISNFARHGHRCAHNENYWRNGDYWGFGVSAASFRDGERSVHTRDLEEYLAAALAGAPIPGETERLEPSKRAGEAVMLALRTAQGVDLSAFKERYGIDFLSYYAPVVAELVQAGLLETTRSNARLTMRGRFLANDACGAFVTFA
jgi:putative oxygen-independent coproporphyrinogen III oxidase